MIDDNLAALIETTKRDAYRAGWLDAINFVVDTARKQQPRQALPELEAPRVAGDRPAREIRMRPLNERQKMVLDAVRSMKDGTDRITKARIARAIGLEVGAVPYVIDRLITLGYLEHDPVRRIRLAPAAGNDPLKMPPPPLPQLRRFEQHAPLHPEQVTGLDKLHPAMVQKRTLFRNMVVEPKDSPRLLISGRNSRKLGAVVQKGEWAGFPIYGLALEERATCPTDCFHIATCYGNSSPQMRRHRFGNDLVEKLALELAELQLLHPGGFVVRLHQLGDFYSVKYVDQWLIFLENFPALHIFGYTAWKPETPIGARVKQYRDDLWERFAIRTSSQDPQPTGATTIWRIPEAPRVAEGIVCPAMTDRTACCATCGLCWSKNGKDETIVFVAHGQTHFAGGTRAENEAQAAAK